MTALDADALMPFYPLRNDLPDELSHADARGDLVFGQPSHTPGSTPTTHRLPSHRDL